MIIVCNKNNNKVQRLFVTSEADYSVHSDQTNHLHFSILPSLVLYFKGKQKFPRLLFVQKSLLHQSDEFLPFGNQIFDVRIIRQIPSEIPPKFSVSKGKKKMGKQFHRKITTKNSTKFRRDFRGNFSNNSDIKYLISKW